MAPQYTVPRCLPPRMVPKRTSSATVSSVSLVSTRFFFGSSSSRSALQRSSFLVKELSATVTKTSPPTATSLSSPPIAVRVLPTAPLRHLRLKLLKSFKAPRGAKADVWLKMADGKFSELGGGGMGDEGAEEGREVEWWLEEGSELAVFIKK